MKTSKLFSTRFLLLATLTVAAASSAACAPQPAPEERGVTKAKLLAPRPMMKATASPSSQATLGVHEWRIYRGRHDVFLTGYDEDGKPVKGLSVGFHASADTSEATLRTRILDGSMFAARHDYAQGRTVARAQLSDDSASFVRQALADIAVLRHVVAQTTQNGATSKRSFGTTPQCGADMMAILSNALQCVQASGGAANPTAITQCLAAAQSAAGVGSACQVTGTTPFDPTQGADPWGSDPYGQAGQDGMGGDPYGQAGDPYGQGGDPYGQGGDPYGQGGNPGGDPYGQGGDPYGQSGNPYGDPYGQGDPNGDWGGGLPNGDWCNDPFGDGACPSCGGMDGMGNSNGMGDWGDIGADPMNGDVGYQSGQGDYGGGWDENF